MTAHSQFKRTRIAPTPSGFLHLGNALSFIITVAEAKKYGASILLRIDDLDQTRVQDSYIQDIFDVLDFLELPWDEGPRNLTSFKQEYSQTHRLPLYQQILQSLQDRNLVFACNCTRSQLQQPGYPGTCLHKNNPLNSPDMNWRLITDTTKTFEARFLETNIFTYSLPVEMDYFVVRKKDGMPSYQLSSVADDIHFGIDFIVRGMDLQPSTIAQRYLANQIWKNSFQKATFLHHQLITNINGEKLSKSAGSTSIQHLRKEGNKKEDIYRLLASLTNTKIEGVKDWQSFAAAYFNQE